MKCLILLLSLCLTACAQGGSDQSAPASSVQAPLPADESEWCGWVIKTAPNQPALNVTTGDLMADGPYSGPECQFKILNGQPTASAVAHW